MCSIFRVPRVHDAAIINVPGVFVVSDNTPGYFMSPRRGYNEKNIFVFLRPWVRTHGDNQSPRRGLHYSGYIIRANHGCGV
ncbi:MAG: hypothetical protein IKQ46_03480 [Bacteroidales bacterium]|nr:hypothetical protein [Bacteroidales bacterium]